jgi:hypothetical protein
VGSDRLPQAVRASRSCGHPPTWSGLLLGCLLAGCSQLRLRGPSSTLLGLGTRGSLEESDPGQRLALMAPTHRLCIRQRRRRGHRRAGGRELGSVDVEDLLEGGGEALGFLGLLGRGELALVAGHRRWPTRAPAAAAAPATNRGVEADRSGATGDPVRPLQRASEPPAAPRWCGFPGWRPECGPPQLP